MPERTGFGTWSQEDRQGILGNVDLTTEAWLQTIYAGHYTLESLQDFINFLSKKIKSDEMIELRAFFDKDGYILLAASDSDRGKRQRYALAGCAHGKDGNE